VGKLTKYSGKVHEINSDQQTLFSVEVENSKFNVWNRSCTILMNDSGVHF